VNIFILVICGFVWIKIVLLINLQYFQVKIPAILKLNTKHVIYPHRSYRITSTNGDILKHAIILLFPLDLVLISFSSLTHYMNILVSFVLNIKNTKIIEAKYIFCNIYLLDLAGKYPDTMQAVYIFIAALAAIILLLFSKIAIPIVSYLVYVILIILISAVYFIFIPYAFPYNITTFSELYIKLQVSWWMIIPLVMLISLLPLPSSGRVKLFISLETLLYSIIFGMVRYVVFIYILKEYSYVFMAVLFFAFGPLVDFIYVIGIYSMHLSKIAQKNKTGISEWRWVY